MNRNFDPKTAYKNSVFVSFFICILTVVGFLQTSEQFLHWFLIPITLSGILIGIDAVNWLRGRLNIFDPVGILGLLGFHFFFLTPLLHVSWDIWLVYVTPPPDWRPWLGGMAILNLLGIWVYRIFRNPGLTGENQSEKTVWRIEQQRFLPILCFSLTLSAVLQILVYQRFGGLTGYINAATDVVGRGEAFAGTGLLFVLSESFPILAMMGFAAYARKNKSMRTQPVLVVVLIIFLVLQIFFGGLRGSRSNTVWALFWAAGIIHFWIRPISKKEISLGLVLLVLFMYMYGFFKAAGLEGVGTALEGQEARASLTEKTGRSWQGLILQDLGRSDIQAFLLYRLMRHDTDYEYAWGRTYVAAVSILIPAAIWPERPENKSKEGTDAQYGMGSYAPGIWVSSKIYGLAGETMLNFGPFVVPFAFVLLGVVVGRVRRWLFTWEATDTRLLLLPMLVNFSFAILVSDADNLVFFMMKRGTLPFLVLLMSCKRETISNRPRNLINNYSHKASN